MGGKGLVLVGLGVEIYELDAWQNVVAHIARNHQNVIYHASCHTICGEFGLVSHLGIILLKVLRHIEFWLLEEFHITHSADHNPYIDWVASLYLILVYRRSDGEMPHST